MSSTAYSLTICQRLSARKCQSQTSGYRKDIRMSVYEIRTKKAPEKKGDTRDRRHYESFTQRCTMHFKSSVRLEHDKFGVIEKYFPFFGSNLAFHLLQMFLQKSMISCLLGSTSSLYSTEVRPRWPDLSISRCP